MGCVGVANFHIKFGPAAFEGIAYVKDDLQADLLLGEPFLTQHDATLAYGQRQVTYGLVTAEMVKKKNLTRKHYNHTNGVAVEYDEEVIIPPHHVRNAIAKVCMQTRTIPTGYDWIFNPADWIQSDEELTMARAIVSVDTDGHIMTQLVNTSDEIIALIAGTITGRLETMEERTKIFSIENQEKRDPNERDPEVRTELPTSSYQRKLRSRSFEKKSWEYERWNRYHSGDETRNEEDDSSASQAIPRIRRPGRQT